MPLQTPFHPRTQALCHSYKWKEWAGYLAVCSFDSHSDAEYFAFRQTAGLIDVSPLFKYDLVGPDAQVAASRVVVSDVSRMQVGGVRYTTMADEYGRILDDGTVSVLAPGHVRLTSTEPWTDWLLRHTRGLDVRITDVSDKVAALSIQGPAARDVLRDCVDFDVDRMHFFRIRPTRIGSIDVWLSRTGFTGDLGYELFCDREHALALWDAVMEAGRKWDLLPVGLDAMDITRIEAGFVLQGIDYHSARSCFIESRTSTVDEVGLGWTIDLDRDPFVGQEAIRAERQRSPRWKLVGLDIHWAGLEALFDEYGLPPSLPAAASREAIPVYGPGGRNQVGQITSRTWSPTLKRYIALATVRPSHAAVGTRLQVEQTVEFRRRTTPATVVDKPFFDPERKKSVLAKGRPQALEAAP